MTNKNSTQMPINMYFTILFSRCVVFCPDPPCTIASSFVLISYTTFFAALYWIMEFTSRITNAVTSITSAMDVADV